MTYDAIANQQPTPKRYDRAHLFLLGAAVLAAVGCGGEDSPVEQCDDFVSTVCDRAVECVPGAGTHQACVQAVQTEVPCGSAESVTASYARCMSQLHTFSCPVLFPNDPQTGQPSLVLPADCVGVIQVGLEVEPAGPVPGTLGESIGTAMAPAR